jgi:hypothetical protein
MKNAAGLQENQTQMSADGRRERPYGFPSGGLTVPARRIFYYHPRSSVFIGV